MTEQKHLLYFAGIMPRPSLLCPDFDWWFYAKHNQEKTVVYPGVTSVEDGVRKAHFNFTDNGIKQSRIAEYLHGNGKEYFVCLELRKIEFLRRDSALRAEAMIMEYYREIDRNKQIKTCIDTTVCDISTEEAKIMRTMAEQGRKLFVFNTGGLPNPLPYSDESCILKGQISVQPNDVILKWPSP